MFCKSGVPFSKTVVFATIIKGCGRPVWSLSQPSALTCNIKRFLQGFVNFLKSSWVSFWKISQPSERLGKFSRKFPRRFSRKFSTEENSQALSGGGHSLSPSRNHHPPETMKADHNLFLFSFPLLFLCSFPLLFYSYSIVICILLLILLHFLFLFLYYFI